MFMLVGKPRLFPVQADTGRNVVRLYPPFFRHSSLTTEFGPCVSDSCPEGAATNQPGATPQERGDIHLLAEP